jgi:hypothetical protein
LILSHYSRGKERTIRWITSISPNPVEVTQMDASKNVELRDLVAAHIIFAVIVVIALLLPNSPIGARLLIAVIAYNVIIPITAVWRGHKRWLEIWIFVLPISILQIFPDWYLAHQLEVLSFPVDGFPMIGDVPIYMAGL